MGFKSAARLLCAALVISGVAQTPRPKVIWQRIVYPAVQIPGTVRDQFTFFVGSGGHNSGTDQEPSHLRFDVMWSARDGVPRPPFLSDVVVRLHTADGKVAARSSPLDWIGIGNGGWTTWQLNSVFSWSRNALDEAWFEVRAAGQTWWIELPYGFARNPEDQEAPDATRNVPQFLATMKPLGAGDILVPWLSVEYEIGRSHSGALLSASLSNPFDAHASVVSYREPPMRVGPDTSRQNLDTPRVAMSIEANGQTMAGHELARRLSEDRHSRTDDFTFDRAVGIITGRAFGTLTISVDSESHALRVPSSLFAYTHGRTEPEHKQWMPTSR